MRINKYINLKQLLIKQQHKIMWINKYINLQQLLIKQQHKIMWINKYINLQQLLIKQQLKIMWIHQYINLQQLLIKQQHIKLQQLLLKGVNHYINKVQNKPKSMRWEHHNIKWEALGSSEPQKIKLYIHLLFLKIIWGFLKRK